MEYPKYGSFIERFGEEPGAYLEKVPMVQLLCVARELEIVFIPPFEEDDPEVFARESIIEAVTGDFQEPSQHKELIRAVENCLNCRN